MANISTSSQKTNKTDIKGWWAPAFFAAAIVIFVLSAWGWWHYVRSDPERTFFAALENSLRTPGVTRHVTQENGEQKLDQTASLVLGEQNLVHGQTAISQTGEVEATIKTETLSSPKEDFVRYTAVDTTQKNAEGKPLDFKDVLNVWGHSTGQGEGGQPAGELYNESVLGVVPYANLAVDQRGPIMDYIRSNDVYKIDEGKVKHAEVAGRPVYVYEVSLSPEHYVGMLKLFGKAVGMTQLEQADPAMYKNAEPLKVQIAVDVWSRHVTGVSMGADQGGRSETIGSYGVARHIALPKDYIPLEDLQNRLQAIQ